METVDPERIEQANMRTHHVADGDDRKAHAIGAAVGGRACGAGRAHAAADDIRADNVEAIRIDRLARPDHPFPPAGLAGDRMGRGDILIAGQRMAQKDRVGPVRIQLAISLERHLDTRELASPIERERAG